MKTNYQKLLDNTINEIVKNNEKPGLLLHSCCAPCSTYVLEYLSGFFNISILYYNPNIYPESEYYFRKEEQKKLIENMALIEKVGFIPISYESEKFYEAIKGLENEPEGGERCKKCFEIRLKKAAEIAKEYNLEYFTTTLTISPHKNAEVLNRIGNDIGEKYNIKYLLSDFKKREGYKRSTELSKNYNLYRQDYCGCVFSKNNHKK